MEYKGYNAKVEYDDEAGLLFGYVVDTRDEITFQGRNPDELRQAFKESVDFYLAYCAANGDEPDKPFSGRFVVRVDPEVCGIRYRFFPVQDGGAVRAAGLFR